MTELRRTLGMGDGVLEPTREELGTWGALTSGATVGPVSPLFPRIERPASPFGDAPAPAAEAADLIDIDTFFRSKLRVATVLSAEAVPKADKLLRLQISLGDETRQLVAGIAQHYEPEDLIGKRIVVVANLKPATIRGVESRGMLLAAKNEGQLRLLTIDGDIPAGSSIG
jgi:methionyl-tRNA synthetase